jgi:hypothetical protein
MFTKSHIIDTVLPDAEAHAALGYAESLRCCAHIALLGFESLHNHLFFQT